MKSNLKNILMFVVIAGLLVAGYLYFFSDGGVEEANIIPYDEPANLNLDGSSGATSTQMTTGGTFNQDLLGLLLSVKSIRLDDAIFRDPAFVGLRDSSIILAPVVDEGRANPFAPIGVDPIPVFTEEDFQQDTQTTTDNGEELELDLEELDNLLDF